MDFIMLKSKIHRAVITESNLNYEGSIEVDTDILEEAGILPFEKVLVVNITNGERLETYAIPGQAGSHAFLLNGAAAHKGKAGDLITIMAFAVFSKKEARKIKPKILIMDEKENKIIKKKKL